MNPNEKICTITWTTQDLVDAITDLGIKPTEEVLNAAIQLIKSDLADLVIERGWEFIEEVIESEPWVKKQKLSIGLTKNNNFLLVGWNSINGYDGSGYGNDDGYGYGDGEEYGIGDGDGGSDGYGDGEGYGESDNCGDGYGYGWATPFIKSDSRKL